MLDLGARPEDSVPLADGAVLGLEPGLPITGEIAVPGSKSIAQRVLVCAGLAAGETRIEGLPDGDDVRAAAALVAGAGARVSALGRAALQIEGRPWSPAAAVSASESGTLARLATAALAFAGDPGRDVEIDASGSLRARSSPPLFAALRAAGVAIEGLGAGWPVRLRPAAPPFEVAIERPVSSQEVSALLVALSAQRGAHRVLVRGPVPSRPYLDLTLATLRDFGGEIERTASADTETFDVRGPLRAPSAPVQIEPDASSAAVALAAACLSGGELAVAGLGRSSAQGDVRIVEHLARFGCRTRADGGRLVAGGRPTRGAEVDLEREPDLAPVLAAVAACAAAEGSPSRLTGLATLQGKESPRISVLARGLSAVGLAVEETADALSIAPGRRAVAPVVLDPHGDHRMAFAFALLGLFVPGVRVRSPQCVAKSWPSFWDDLRRAGARVSA